MPHLHYHFFLWSMNHEVVEKGPILEWFLIIHTLMDTSIKFHYDITLPSWKTNLNL